jgi:hypothetical protein
MDEFELAEKQKIRKIFKKNAGIWAVESTRGTYTVGSRKILMDYIEEMECKFDQFYEIGDTHPALVFLTSIDWKSKHFSEEYQLLD